MRALWAVMMIIGLNTAYAGDEWPHWETFKSTYISQDGRVIDGSDPRQITTSEGQSYAMFFALVANDKATFDHLYTWTRQYLAEGDLTARLPAWLWGVADGKGQVIDDNSASDSDLWIAYSLIEAGRLWEDDYYQNVGFLLAERIIREETIELVSGERQLLPGRVGFEFEDHIRLNPSYLPLPLLAKLVHTRGASTQWGELLKGTHRLLAETQPHGISPDWVLYDADEFYYEGKTTDIGSYNAIRTYLWAGMTPTDMSGYEHAIMPLHAFAERVSAQGYVPRQAHAQTGDFKHIGPVGFQAALLPLLVATQHPQTAQTLASQVSSKLIKDRRDEYYNNVLTLFGTGWYEQRYAFDRQGNVLVTWHEE